MAALYGYLVILSIVSLSIAVNARDIPYAGETIGYQIHSYDDIREWESVLRKGALALKIDGYYMDASFCASQKHLNPDSRGCFLMTHDKPHSNISYDSLFDTLDFIRENPSYFNRTSRFYIALCFKPQTIGGSWCASSCSYCKDIISLVDTFYEKANQLIEELNLNLEFVLDGAGTPVWGNECLADKWRPWIATWNIQPLAAFLSDDPDKAYDRFQIFNLPVGQYAVDKVFQAYAALGFGKFANGSYPYQVWEPEDEEEIVKISKIYLSSAKTFNNSHTPGFLFSINIDPQMFNVYSSSLTGRGYHDSVINDDSATNPKVALVFQDKAMLIVASVPSGIIYTLYKLPSTPFGALTPAFTGSSPDFANSKLESLSPVFDGSSVLICDTVAQCLVYKIGNGELTRTAALKLEPKSHKVKISAVRSILGSETEIAQITSDSKNYYLQIWSLNEKAVPTLRLSGEFGPADDINHASIAVARTPGDCLYEGLSTFSTESLEIKAYHVCIKANNSNIALYANGRHLGLNMPSIIGVGSSSEVALTMTERGLFAVEVHGDGYCFNSHEHNIRAAPKMCDQKPTSMPHVLDYSYGALSSWAHHLSAASHTIINSCHAEILHGTYDQGASPAVAVTATEAGILPLFVHEGYKASWNDTFVCGQPIARPGIVLDSWLVDPSMIVFD